MNNWGLYLIFCNPKIPHLIFVEWGIKLHCFILNTSVIPSPKKPRCQAHKWLKAQNQVNLCCPIRTDQPVNKPSANLLKQLIIGLFVSQLCQHNTDHNILDSLGSVRGQVKWYINTSNWHFRWTTWQHCFCSYMDLHNLWFCFYSQLLLALQSKCIGHSLLYILHSIQKLAIQF